MCSHLDEKWPSISIYTHCVLLDRKLASTSADSYNSYTITLVLFGIATFEKSISIWVLFVIYDSHSKDSCYHFGTHRTSHLPITHVMYVVLKFLTGKAAEDNVP